jgi:hypothetical protein
VKKLIFIIILVLAAYLLWRWWNSDKAGTADRGGQLVYDRLWVDHLPKDDRDEINVFAAISDEPIGIFQATSMWRGSFELFRYENKGDGKIVITYPQTRDKERAAYRAKPCNEKGFDFCMELDGASRGVKRYFSQKGWELRSHSLPAAAREARGLFAAPPAQ